MTAALYTRVSTMNQVDRDSLSTQESRLRAYCEANGYPVREVYEDAGFSAKDTKRPALLRLFDDIRAGRVRTVLVTRLDRITRSLRDLVQLVDFFSEHEVKFISISQNLDNSGPFGRFMRDLLGLIAQLEREVTAERVSEDMYHRASQGKWNGGVIPYGYTTRQRAAKELTDSGMDEYKAEAEAARLCPEPKKLYVDEQEAGVVRDIFRTYLETRSLRRTTHTLNSSGQRTRRGAAWSAPSVRRVLTSPTYTGKTWYGKRKTNPENGRLQPVAPGEWRMAEGEHEGIIPEETFAEAQDVLASNTNKPTRAKNTYLLAGLLRCGKCGGPMHGYTFTKKGTDKTYIYYKCHNYTSKGKSVCDGMTIPARDFEDFVIDELMKLSRDRAFLGDKERMLAALKEEAERASQGESEELEQLSAEEKRLESRLETLLEKLEEGLIDDGDFDRRYQKLKASLSENRAGQERAREMAVHPGATLEALKASFEEISSFGGNWEFLDDEGKKLKLRTVVKEIRVFSDRRVDIQVFLDVEDVCRRDRGSWRPPA